MSGEVVSFKTKEQTQAEAEAAALVEEHVANQRAIANQVAEIARLVATGKVRGLIIGATMDDGHMFTSIPETYDAPLDRITGISSYITSRLCHVMMALDEDEMPEPPNEEER